MSLTSEAPTRQLSHDERSRRTRAALLAAHATRAPHERSRLLDEVVLLNTRVAEAVAARYRGRGVPEDDLRQAAYEGLVKAVHRFDPARREDLLTYAVPTVRGEVLRHFRDRSWFVRPPRRVQDLQRRVHAEVDRLTHELGRSPSAAEVSSTLAVDRTEYDEAVASVGCFRPASLDQPVGAGSTTSRGTLVVEQSHPEEAAEARSILAPALSTLGARDRRLLHRFFVDDATQSQIGEELGVSQMQVSRLLTRILRDLRRLIEDSAGPVPTPTPTAGAHR